MKERMKRIEQAITNLQQDATDLRQNVTDLESRVEDLSLASEGYSNIVKGNGAAHHADAVTDAALYTSHERHDETLLKEIYGLSAFQISFLGKYQIF
jgi:predicted nuclease with TOPRIM domain